MELAREEQPEKSKVALQLLNRYGPSILDNSITEDELKNLHISFIRIPADGKQFVDGIWPYLNQRQRYVLMQRLIPIEVETCVERNALFRSKSFLLYLLHAEAHEQNFAANYAAYLDECRQQQEFFELLLKDPLPQLLACVFQSLFHLIVKQKAEPMLEESLGRKLDADSEKILQKINGAKLPNQVYALIDNAGLAELWIFNIVKAVMREKIDVFGDAQVLLLTSKLNGWLNRKNPAYVGFCQQYYQNICAVSDQMDFVDKTKAEIDADRCKLMLETQTASIPAFFWSKYRIIKDKADARKSQRAPLTNIDANENVAEPRNDLPEVLDAYLQELSACPTPVELLEQLEYLKLTLQAYLRRSGGPQVDESVIARFQDTLSKILAVVDVNTLTDEDQAAVNRIASEIRVLLGVEEMLENAARPE